MKEYPFNLTAHKTMNNLSNFFVDILKRLMPFIFLTFVLIMIMASITNKMLIDVYYRGYEEGKNSSCFALEKEMKNLSYIFYDMTTIYNSSFGSNISCRLN